MASPLVESRIEPHKKAQFSLHISDQITHGDTPHSSYSSVKYNHKPTQTSDKRKTTLTSTSADAYNLRLEDSSRSGSNDVFTFTGNRSASKKSYVLLFDPSTQQATLEPLTASYTFNIATRNSKDVSSQHAKMHVKKTKEEGEVLGGEDDLFGGDQDDDASRDPNPSNPYDFRHFLRKEQEKRGDESDYTNLASSPDYRGIGSVVSSPQLGASKPAATTTTKAKAAEPIAKKRKTATADLFMKKKPGPKKSQPAPAIKLERRVTEKNATTAPSKAKGKATQPPASKIKSAEIVHSSDDSDMDAEGEAEPASSPPRLARRSPSPVAVQTFEHGDDEDAEGESDDGGLEIEVPDARPSRPRNGGALASLGLGQSLGVGRGHRSPSNGPISLASATSSVQGSPNPHNHGLNRRGTLHNDSVIDFGALGDDAEEEDDEDVGELEIEDPDVEDVIDIGPSARQSTAGHDRKPSNATALAEEDEEDPLYQEMMAGLAGGDSSEESEEE